jgi:hypothetical protein
MKNRIGTLLAALASIVVTGNAAAQFTNTPVTGLPGVDSSTVAWGDYNNDGRLDFLITGTTNSSTTNAAICQLWSNTGSGFTNAPISRLQGVIAGNTAWSDWNNDGRLDFIVTGTTNGDVSGAICQLWRNTTNSFTNVTSIVAPGLPQVYQSSATWGDFNNDGKADILLMGSSSTGRLAQIWLNTGTIFTNATSTLAPGLVGVGVGSVSVADYDGDGYSDFLLLGEQDNNTRTTQLWKNTGAGFVDVTETVLSGLTNVSFGSTAWGDYDNDGKMDLFVMGSASGQIAQLWRNTGTVFTNVPIAGLNGFRYGTVKWADFDNDGNLDFAIDGITNSPANSSAEIWRNTGTGFTNMNVNLPRIYSSSFNTLGWGDYDNDGRIDLLLAGSSSTGAVAQVWKNYTPTTNTPPPAPASLSASVANGITILSWSAPNDTQSGTHVSYNVRIGSASGKSDIVNPLANITNGFRRLPALGNAQLATNLPLTLPAGVYYWSVQAVDGGLRGGAFATESSFTVAPTLSIAPSGSNVILSWESSAVGWVLQESTNLLSGIWSNSPSGGTNPINLSASSGNKFFRLFKP